MSLSLYRPPLTQSLWYQHEWRRVLRSIFFANIQHFLNSENAIIKNDGKLN